MTHKKGCFGLGAANSLLLVLLIAAAAGTAVFHSLAPYYAMKSAEFGRGGILTNPDITQFEMVLRIKNTQDIFARLPASDFTVYFGGESIGSGRIEGLSIPPEGTLPFPLRWDVPEGMTAGKLFELQRGGKPVRIEIVMHVPLPGAGLDIPMAVEFDEAGAKVL